MRALLMVLVLAVLHCRPVQHLAEIKPLSGDIKSGTSDSLTEQLVQPYRIQLSVRMEEVIGHCSVSLRKELPESNLGNFFCDALMTEGALVSQESIDAAVQNYGGLRIPSIEPGPVTVGKIFELMPFDNMMVILDLPGAEVDSLCQAIAADEGWPVSKEIRFTIREGKAENIFIQGVPLNDQKLYRVLMPDYVANGYNRMYFLSDNRRENTGIFIRDAIIAHVRRLTARGESVQAGKDGRITMHH